MTTNTELESTHRAEVESLLQGFSQARQALQRPNSRFGSDSKQLGSRFLIKTSEANLDTFEQSSRNVEASSRSSLLFGTQADQKSVNTHVFHGAAGQVDSGAVFTHDGQSSILHGTLSPAEIRSRGRKSARPNERAQERPEKETAGDRLAAWEHELIRRAEALDQAEETLREAETRCAESATEMEQARADLAEALRNASRREEECARREEE